jgi:hypothetical protein
MRYFPLTTDRFEHQFGIRALAESESIIEATDRYQDEIQLRRGAFADDPAYYFSAEPTSIAAQRDARDLILTAADFLTGGRNSKLNESVDCQGEPPLLEIARHVQEDLAIISDDAERGFPLIAGAIAFPSGWCIGDKLGKSVLAIHDPVPGFASELNLPTQRLMQRLKPARPVWRMNWGVRPSGQLDQSPRHQQFLRQRGESITADNAGHECFFRVERQTLARLQPSGAILFAIHTHCSPLNELSAWQRQNLLGVIRSCGDETLDYKGILVMREPIVSYLQHSLE